MPTNEAFAAYDAKDPHTGGAIALEDTLLYHVVAGRLDTCIQASLIQGWMSSLTCLLHFFELSVSSTMPYHIHHALSSLLLNSGKTQGKHIENFANIPTKLQSVKPRFSALAVSIRAKKGSLLLGSPAQVRETA